MFPVQSEVHYAAPRPHAHLRAAGRAAHAFHENARQLRLTFTKDATGLTVTAPSSGNITPPGHYMVFIVNGTDVPSVAKIVKIY